MVLAGMAFLVGWVIVPRPAWADKVSDKAVAKVRDMMKSDD